MRVNPTIVQRMLLNYRDHQEQKNNNLKVTLLSLTVLTEGLICALGPTTVVYL